MKRKMETRTEIHRVRWGKKERWRATKNEEKTRYRDIQQKHADRERKDREGERRKIQIRGRGKRKINKRKAEREVHRERE